MVNLNDIKFVVQLYELDTDNEYDDDFRRPSRKALTQLLNHLFFVHEIFDTNLLHLHFSTSGDGEIRCETENEGKVVRIVINENSEKSYIYYQVHDDFYDADKIVTDESVLWYLAWTLFQISE